jgi:hypothetical protein|tara:strand:- start:166 stop:558 length:393 start_codon:yes stop_codon:yes gene_type:complete
MIDKQTTERINQLLNNGFTFGEHKTKKERDEIEEGLVDWYEKNGIGAFVEEEMLYVVDSKHEHIMMLEITKNSIYFNPHEHLYLLDAIVITLEYITDKLVKKETLEEVANNIEDEITEEMPKQKPDFGTL